MSEPEGSISGTPDVIHSATQRAMPGASLIQIADTDQRPFTSGVSPSSGSPSGVSDSRPLIACRMPTLGSPRMSGISSSACSSDSSKSSLVKGNSVGDSLDWPMVVGAHLEVTAVLAFVAVGIHVADDGVLDLADGVGKQRHRPDTDHLVHRGTERDRSPGHAGETRAPDAARDDHGLGFDIALVRPHSTDPAVFDIDR